LEFETRRRISKRISAGALFPTADDAGTAAAAASGDSLMRAEASDLGAQQAAQLARSSLGRDVTARSGLSRGAFSTALALRQCGVVRGAAARGSIGARFVPSRPLFVDKYAHQAFCGKFSKSGALFMSASQDRHIRLYDTGTWRLTKDIVANDVGWSIIAVDYSPDDRWVIYSSWSDYVHLYNTSGAPVYEPLNFRPSTGRFCLFSSEFSPSSTEILAGASDHCIYLYDLERKLRTHRIRGHADDVNSICWLDAGGQLFASGSDDRLVMLWDRRLVSAGGQGDARGCVGAFVGHARGVACVSSRGDGLHLLSNGKDHCAKLWDVRALQSPAEARAAATALAPGSMYDYRHGERRRPNEPRLRHALDTSLMTYRGGHQVYRTLLRAHFSPLESTGSRYVIAGSNNNTACIYETLTGEIAAILGGDATRADGGVGPHTDVVRDVSWHPWKPEIVTTSWDGSCRLWSFALHNELERKRAEDDYAFRSWRGE
jgi:WD repeat-containing protein 23